MGTVPLIDTTLPLSMPIQPVSFTNCEEATPRCTDRGSTNPFPLQKGGGWVVADALIVDTNVSFQKTR